MVPHPVAPTSRVRLVHTSSPVSPKDQKDFERSLKELSRRYGGVKVVDVTRDAKDLHHLAASSAARLAAFREAAAEADWLLPVYGGTGAIDLVSRFTKEDQELFRRVRPVVQGFSDATHFLNYLFFSTELRSFHYVNATGLFSSKNKNHELFIEAIEGKRTALSFESAKSRWLAEAPEKPVEGIAIGGNLSTFRDLLDVCPDIEPSSWRDYVLFAEDVALDGEDLHRVIVSLDRRGVFREIRALVLGSFELRERGSYMHYLRSIFGRAPYAPLDPHHIILYLLEETRAARAAAGDPLPILFADNFGHHEEENPMIIPVGGRTSLSPSGTVFFQGPFVD